MKQIKTFVKNIAILLCFLAAGFMAPLEAHSQEPASSVKAHVPVASAIEIVGRTKDGKYPIYVLEGGYNDISWHSGQKQYNSWDLFGQMVFVDRKDIGHPYLCGFVCKDPAKNIVGLNPSYAFMVAGK